MINTEQGRVTRATRATTFRRLVEKHKGTFVRFGMVGASGVLVNTVLLYALTEAGGLSPVFAAVLATEAAILCNFFLNDLWTFRKGRSGSAWGQRALRYNLGALGGLLISVAVLAMLTHLGGMYYLEANLFAIAVSTVWNYLASYFFIWSMPQAGAVVSVPSDAGFKTT